MNAFSILWALALAARAATVSVEGGSVDNALLPQAQAFQEGAITDVRVLPSGEVVSRVEKVSAQQTIFSKSKSFEMLRADASAAAVPVSIPGGKGRGDLNHRYWDNLQRPYASDEDVVRIGKKQKSAKAKSAAPTKVPSR